MNERLKELFKRAGGKTSIHNLMSNPVQHREYNELWDENITKFAELIVKECASRVDNILREKKHGGGTMGDEIREHFGVEE